MTDTRYGEVGKRVILAEYGEDPLDAIEHHLSLVEQPPPDPAGLREDDVVVAVRSAAVGWVDLLMCSGQYQHMVSPPYTPGMEYSGEVVWTGSAVDPKRLAVGDAVLADGFLTGPRSQGAHQQYGGFASYAVAPAKALRPLPTGFSFDQGCHFLGNYETAYHCLLTCGQLRDQDVVLVHGASGCTGLAAVHLAKIVGATVLATGRSLSKLAEVQAQGADHVIWTSDPLGGTRAFSGEVKRLTQGRGVDVVFDNVGGDISMESLRCVAFGARFLIVGWASTPFVARGKGKRGAPHANMLPTNLIMMKGLKVLGCPTVISTYHDPSIRAERTNQLMSWVEEGKLSPHVSGRFPLSQVKEAMVAKWESRFVGGCVVQP